MLKSWAVPKGPSLDPADKRLAVETEDHPLDYVDFEGVIPEGEYGGGPMIVWDTGTWAPMGDAEKDLAAGAFKFRLAGEKLGGGWMLTRLKPRPGEKKRTWLLFKERDQAAAPGTDILVGAAREREERPADRGAGGRRPPRRRRRSGCGRGRWPARSGDRRPRGWRRSSPASVGEPPAGRRTGCTRSSSTATARWRIAPATRCG